MYKNVVSSAQNILKKFELDCFETERKVGKNWKTNANLRKNEEDVADLCKPNL